MKCPECQSENPEDAKFCGKCRAKLLKVCPQCGRENSPGNLFCNECGHDLRKPAVPSAPTDYSQPQSYTPKYLAEKILQSRSALEGGAQEGDRPLRRREGSMDLAEQVDPEEWHRVLDRFFQILTEGVHRYEGTVNQYTGDGMMALFGAPIAHVELGWVEEGLARMRAVVNATRAADMRIVIPTLLVMLTQACGKAGLTDEGLAAVAEALELVEQTGERLELAMLHATRGDLLLAACAENQAEAEACFRQALDVARSQEARVFELRAATGLARLCQRQGKREEARELLAPVYDWFTEGFDTLHLKEARALLDELV